MIKGSGAQKNLMNDLIWRKNTSIIPINTFCSFFAGFPHADTLFRTIRIGVSLLNHPGWHQKQHENQGLILQPSHLHDVLEEGAEDDDKEDFGRPLSLIISEWLTRTGFWTRHLGFENPIRVFWLIEFGFISMFWRLRMWYQDLFFLSSCWWENLQREMEQQEDDGGGVGHIAVEEVPVVFWKAK